MSSTPEPTTTSKEITTMNTQSLTIARRLTADLDHADQAETIKQDLLDDTLHDIASEIGSTLVNSSRAEQVEFLIQQLGDRGAEDLLRQLGVPSQPTTEPADLVARDDALTDTKAGVLAARARELSTAMQQIAAADPQDGPADPEYMAASEELTAIVLDLLHPGRGLLQLNLAATTVAVLADALRAWENGASWFTPPTYEDLEPGSELACWLTAALDEHSAFEIPDGLTVMFSGYDDADGSGVEIGVVPAGASEGVLTSTISVKNISGLTPADLLGAVAQTVNEMLGESA